jgi:hypothetical protein
MNPAVVNVTRSPSTFLMKPCELPLGQQVCRGLMVANRPEDARRHDFRLCFNPELDTPLRALWIPDVIPGTVSRIVDCYELEWCRS